MKYQIAYSNKHNCTNKNGHAFNVIRDETKIKEIRKQHPRLSSALWQCVNCKKVISSM